MSDDRISCQTPGCGRPALFSAVITFPATPGKGPAARVRAPNARFCVHCSQELVQTKATVAFGAPAIRQIATTIAIRGGQPEPDWEGARCDIEPMRLDDATEALRAQSPPATPRLLGPDGRPLL